MKKTANKTLVILATVATLLSRGSPASAQTALPMVVASIGSEAQIGNTNISYTVGEAVITTIAIDSNYLTQGFEQPHWLTVGIIEATDDDIKIFPNPTPGLVNVHISSSQTFDAAIYDVLGNLVVKPPNISGNAQIDLDGLAPANYVLLLTNSTKRYTIKLLKLN